MTDFYISAIRMDKTSQHIEFVKVFEPGKSMSVSSRQFIGELINTGKIEFRTAIHMNGKWKAGAVVRVTSAGYITTDPNGTTLDNLGNLPTF
ncbi:DUF3892 domain-containing protein [Morganella morganii]|uniref:DUF3892 domain-containing protein n=1 Tax=Morganella morganii TaxID=582 RepID=UPI0034D6E253